MTRVPEFYSAHEGSKLVAERVSQNNGACPFDRAAPEHKCFAGADYLQDLR